MTVRDLLVRAEQLTRDNSSAILTALAASGTVTTAYLTGKASWNACEKIFFHEIEGGNIENKEKVKLVWKLYIPPAISGVVTIACVVTAAKINSRRTAALTAAYTLSEKAYSEYKEKVIETLGEKKEKKVRDEIAADQVERNPPPNSSVLLAGSGDVLCCEMWTGRYFHVDVETLKRAVNTINSKLNSQNEATLSDFYYLIGIPTTSSSSYSGWTSDKLMELSYSSVLHNEKPCMTFEYNYVKTF